MRRPSASTLLPVTALVMLVASACGKRADPLAPYVKTPQPPSSLEIAQIGDAVELRVVAPRTTTENRPLPVIQLEWLEAPPEGPIAKESTLIEREDVAPGELRVKRIPIPTAPLRFAVRARSGKAASAYATAEAYTPKPVPSPPTGLQATVQPDGVRLQWTNPVGAEPWPTPSPSPTPSPAGPGQAPSPESTLTPTPSDSLADAEKPGPPPAPPAAPPAGEPGVPPVPPSGEKPAAPPGPGSSLPPGIGPMKPDAQPAPAPTPTPLPPTGIRIFRTDGVPRPATEPLQASTWLDTSLKPGDKPCYAVSYATAFKPLIVSVQTEPVCVEIKDVVPPNPPTRLAADLAAAFVEVSWLASDSTDVAFYRLYRTIGTGTREVALETAGLATRVQDPTMTPGPRVYEVVAVDAAGNESEATPPVRIVVP